MTTPDSQRVVPAEATYAVTRDQLVALVAGPYMYHHKMDDAAIREGDAFNRCRDMTIERIDVLIATRNAMLTAAPAASPPVAPLAAAQDGVVAWRYVQTNGFAWKWNDGAPTTAEYENAGDETIELAYSRPPAQTQGAAKPDAWLHQVVGDDGEPDQALSFSPDNFPLEGVAGYRSLSHAPLYLGTPATPEDRRDGERWRRLCEYVDVGEGRVLINHNYVDSRKNFVAEMSDSSDLIVNMDNAIAADKTRIAAIDAAREG